MDDRFLNKYRNEVHDNIKFDLNTYELINGSYHHIFIIDQTNNILLSLYNLKISYRKLNLNY